MVACHVSWCVCVAGKTDELQQRVVVDLCVEIHAQCATDVRCLGLTTAPRSGFEVAIDGLVEVELLADHVAENTSLDSTTGP